MLAYTKEEPSPWSYSTSGNTWQAFVQLWVCFNHWAISLLLLCYRVSLWTLGIIIMIIMSARARRELLIRFSQWWPPPPETTRGRCDSNDNRDSCFVLTTDDDMSTTNMAASSNYWEGKRCYTVSLKPLRASACVRLLHWLVTRHTARSYTLCPRGRAIFSTG